MKFEIGDKVKVKGVKSNVSFKFNNRNAIITKIGSNGDWYNIDLEYPDDSGIWGCELELIERGSIMSEHEKLKQRITHWYESAQGKGGGWDKELDDILEEMNLTHGYSLSIGVKKGEYRITILNDDTLQKIEVFNKFYYKDQCHKLTALRDAVLWLLDNSDISKNLVGKTAEVEVDGQKYEAKLLKVID